MDVCFLLVLGTFVVGGEAAVPIFGQGNGVQSHEGQIIPRCDVGETCTIDRNCRAPDGTSYCVKDIWIKECPAGQSECTLYNGTTGCSSSCDGVPECAELSDEEPCNKYKCKTTWRMVFEHDSKGNVLAGSKSDLMNAVRRGAEIKMFRGEYPYVDSADTTLIVGDEVCAQSLHQVSKASWAAFQGKAYWWFTVTCTSGDFSMSRWYVGDRTKPGDDQAAYGFKWFAREVEDKYMTAVPATGSDISAVNAHIQAVKQSGYGVTVKQESKSLNTEEYYRADNLEVSLDDKEIVAQTVWNLLNEKYKTVVKISTSGHWLFQHFASNGQVEVSQYLLGENRRVSFDSSKRETKWYFDPCWQFMYSHDQNGIRKGGSILELINAVKAGHRVKVMINNRISQATNVIVKKDVITAFLSDILKKSSIETLEDPTGAKGKWDWMLVNTNGKVETANYLVGEGQGSMSSSAADMKWFIDRREWNIVLDVGPTSVNSGSKEHLANEIKDGADVRYSWIGSTWEYTFMEADNIGFDGSKPDFGAKHIRSVLLKPNGNEYKFDVTSNKLTWLFSITTNSGVVRSSKWIVGEHASRGETTANHRVMWFIAK
ncbi:uncharacterized protein LOC132713780 isoform X2 [Ruditapes philippinarum]|uniref:uncharacterized protein LOC132713780 isoform X2 n=1 Tax=Ruditapes philippinarum TaxID=129788 RepID=UPI00295C2F23|nr:uncharacterized protein LOC132713780 isoform X2 [Ruditapes philippinarum]